MENTLTELERKVNFLQAENKNSERVNAELGEKIALLRNDYEGLQQEKDRLTPSVKTLRKKVLEQEIIINGLERRKELLASELNNFQTLLEDLKNEIKSETIQVENLKKEKKDLSEMHIKEGVRLANKNKYLLEFEALLDVKAENLNKREKLLSIK